MTQPRPSFTCPDCRRTSYHPKDVEHCYCGNCHAFKAESYMYSRCMEPSCPSFGVYGLLEGKSHSRVKDYEKRQGRP